MLNIFFNTKTYDPFLDFLKGLCIFFVVLTHSIDNDIQELILFPYWGSFAVPCFFLISFFHFFRHPNYSYKELFIKTFKRVFRPFIFAQLIIVFSILLSFFLGGGRLSTPLKNIVLNGGGGPGTYFVWAYLQFSLIILPLFYYVIGKCCLCRKQVLLLSLLMSIILEFLSSFFELPLYVHRLTFFPYVFIIYYSYLLANGGILFKRWTPVILVFSIVGITLMSYTNFDFYPFVYMDTAKVFHWFCYPFLVYVFCVVAKVMYNNTGGGIRKVLLLMGKHSYEIFIFQMLVFYYMPCNINKYLYVVICIFFSIVPVIVYYKIKSKWLTIVK